MAKAKKQEIVVKAAVPFVDARTGKSYNLGDIVEGWEEERAEHYAGLGLVYIVVSKENPHKPGPKEVKETEKKRPGPKETKTEERADFTSVSGVGVATDEALHENGIHTFEALAEADVSFLPGKTQSAIEEWRAGRA